MFRPALVEDIPRVYKLIRAVYTEGEDVGTEKSLCDKYFDPGHKAVLFIDEDDKGNILGSGGIGFEKIILSDKTIINAGYMMNLAVLPQYRDGSFVLQYISQLFEMVKDGSLDLIFHINHREKLIDMYKRIGFDIAKALPIRIFILDFAQVFSSKRIPAFIGLPLNFFLKLIMLMLFNCNKYVAADSKNINLNTLSKEFNFFVLNNLSHILRDENMLYNRLIRPGIDYEIIQHIDVSQNSGFAIVRHLNRNGYNLSVIMDLCAETNRIRMGLLKGAVVSARKAGSAFIMGAFPEKSLEDRALLKKGFWYSPKSYMFIGYPKNKSKEILAKQGFYFSMFSHDSF